MHGVKRLRLSDELKQQKVERDKIKIQNYNNLQDIVLTNKQKSVFDDRALEQTAVLLDMNPEFYTIWNYRRDILKHLYGSAGEQNGAYLKELGFVLRQMMKNPKCYWIWNHRIWCLKAINSRQVYEQELEFVSQMLAKDERNFHGWAYRRAMISAIESYIEDDEELLALLVSEFEYTTKKINKNISNYSAWHNRTKLIIRIFEQQELTSLETKLFASKKDFIDKELQMVTNALFMDSEDSSIWYYLRWLISTDYFLPIPDLKQPFLDTLRDTITELNEMEKEDNNNKDNEMCIKTLQLIHNSSI